MMLSPVDAIALYRNGFDVINTHLRGGGELFDEWVELDGFLRASQVPDGLTIRRSFRVWGGFQQPRLNDVFSDRAFQSWTLKEKPFDSPRSLNMVHMVAVTRGLSGFVVPDDFEMEVLLPAGACYLVESIREIERFSQQVWTVSVLPQ